MPENTNERIEQSAKHGNEQAKERSERTLNNRNLDTLITEHENPEDDSSNFLNEKVVDVIELLNSKENNEVLIKLNRLRDFGVTDDMIVALYKDYSGNISSKDAAIETLDIIFKRLVSYISDLPNAIVLDPETGYVDKAASIAQGYEHGIYSDKNEFFFAVETKMPLLTTVPESVKAEISSSMNMPLFVEWEFQKLMNAFTPDMIKEQLNDEVKESINENLKYDVEELELAFEIKKALLENRKHMESYEYEKDPDLYEITALEVAYHKAEGTEKDEYERRVKEFYDKHPEYKGKVNVLDKNGNLKTSSQFRIYKNLYKFEQVASQLEDSLKMDKKAFDELSPDDKKMMTISLFKGFSYMNKNNGKYKMLATYCQAELKKYFPDLDLSQGTLGGNGIELAKIAKNALGMDIEEEALTSESFGKMIDKQMEILIDNYLINDKEVFKIREDQVSLISEKEYEENYTQFFEGSSIKLKETDLPQFRHSYKAATVNAWVENKKDALLLRYLSLKQMKEKFEKMPKSEYADKKLAEIDAAMNDFQERHGEEFKAAHGDPEKWSRSQKRDNLNLYKSHSAHRAKAELMNTYSEDFEKFKNGLTYDKMSNDEKKKYIRNTLARYNAIKGNDPETVGPVILRRLELMNTEERKIVTFDENGKPIVNEDMILEEYQSLSEGKHQWQSFEELAKDSKEKGEIYAMNSLAKLVELDGKDFKIIDARNQIEKCFETILKHRFVMRARRAEKANEVENETPISDKEMAAAMREVGMRAETLDDSAVKAAVEEPEVREDIPEDVPEMVAEVIHTPEHQEVQEELQGNSYEDADESAVVEEELDDAEENIGIIGKIGKAFTNLKDKIIGRFSKQKRLPEAADHLKTDVVGGSAAKKKEDDDSRDEEAEIHNQNDVEQTFDQRIAVSNWGTRGDAMAGTDIAIGKKAPTRQDSTRSEER